MPPRLDDLAQSDVHTFYGIGGVDHPPYVRQNHKSPPITTKRFGENQH